MRMSRKRLEKIPLRGDPFARWGSLLYRTLLGLFLIQLLFVGIRLFVPAMLPEARWPEGLLLVLATASIICSTARQLPVQNVMLAGLIIACIGGLSQTIGVLTSMPFGPYGYTNRIPLLFPPLPWAIPVLWLLMVLISRGVGRLILRPWRKTRNYGFWLIGITTGLVLIFDLGLEPYATYVQRYWYWEPSHAFLFWYKTPWVNFIGWAATTLVILGFATPSFINKKPVKHPPDYWPLALWIMLNSFFAAAFIANHLWLGAAVIPAFTLIVTIFAIKGARW
jgi:uncharacterized membrane protein